MFFNNKKINYMRINSMWPMKLKDSNTALMISENIIWLKINIQDEISYKY